MSRICSRCCKNVQDDAALFCPYCGSGLSLASTQLQTRRATGFPIAAGILTIVFSFVALSIISRFFVLGPFLSIPIFAFGITGGTLSLMRKHFVLSIFGMSLLTVEGFLVLQVTWLFGSTLFGLFFGTLIIIPSILSIILVATSKDEFV